MARFDPPLRDMQFVLHEVLSLEKNLQKMPEFAEFDTAMVDQILEEGGKFARDVLFPLNLSGDQEGCTFDAATRTVTTPKGFADAYKQYVAAGWSALAADPNYGGQGLPVVVNTAFTEMLYTANQSWAMYPCLTMGAWECLHAHGTEQQKETYMRKLIEGVWCGTMCLTEPHCGTDLGMLRTKATPNADGSYNIEGNKIFISSGDHDFSENIVHLVLARLPDAPSGTKGISLFIVPKFLVNADGSLGARNPVFCTGLEHKMGIHGNATAQIALEGATGYLVGEPNKGLNAMFTMMNGARLGVGMMGLGMTEIAYQNSLDYAKSRLQSRSLSGAKMPDKPADPIIVHPDVRRMLLTQKAYVEAGRAFGYWVGLLLDQSRAHPDEAQRKHCGDLVALLTPIVKAFMTDNSFECTNLAVQIFGGHGYIAEYGMEQYVRDARINQIYEGTNAIQSLDLLGRKVLGDQGAKLKQFGAYVLKFIEQYGVDAKMDEFITPLADLSDKVQKLTFELGFKGMQNPDEVGAAAVDYLRVVGHWVYAYFWARMAAVAQQKIAAGATEGIYESKIQTARFYFQRLLPETAMLIRRARSGANNVLAMPENLF